MKLWNVVITDQKFPLASARIAAPTREDALRILKEESSYEGSQPIVCSFMGLIDVVASGVTVLNFRVVSS